MGKLFSFSYSPTMRQRTGKEKQREKNVIDDPNRKLGIEL